VPVELYCASGQHHGRSEDDRTMAHASRLYLDAVGAAIA
jgi:hypothetical protein